MKQSHELCYFETADEDHFDLLLGFDDHALENLSYDLIIIIPSYIVRLNDSSSVSVSPMSSQMASCTVL